MDEFLAHCEKHGPYTALRIRDDRASGCPRCRQEAFELEDSRRRKRDNEVRRREWKRRALLAATIPPKFRLARIAALAPPFNPAISRWLDLAAAGRSTGPLILCGHVGTGKSFAAAAAVRHWIARAHQPARFVVAADYCATIRETWRRDARVSEAEIEREHARIALLVVDDLGAGRAADLEIVQGLVCARYAAGTMPTTIVSTNLAPLSFAQALGERIADRLREGAVLVTATGPSRRRPSP